MLDRLLERLMEMVIENAGAEKGYLILDKEGQWSIEAVSVVEPDEIIPLLPLPLRIAALGRTPLLSAAIVNYVIRAKESVVLNDAAREGPFIRDPYIVARRPKSVLGMPFLNQGRLVGILYLENNLTSGAFTPERLTILNLLSSQAAISIENARLYWTLGQSEQKYRALFEDSKDAIFMTDASGQILDINPAGQELFGRAGAELRGMPVEGFYVQPDDLRRVELALQEQGLVKDFEVKFQQKDGRQIDGLITATVRQAEGGAILGYQGIIRDITAHKQAERERLQLSALQRELTIAREIQQNLLPPAQPPWSDLEVVCYNLPAREVGGDFYSYHLFPPLAGEAKERRYALAVGDVSGKGVSAALLMATSLSQFDASLFLDFSPTGRLAYLDQAILPYTQPRRQNCALCYIELERNRPAVTPTGFETPSDLTSLRVVNAGCIPPTIRRAGGAVEELEAGGFALGQGLGARLGYQEVCLNLAKGDLIILTSDGVVEARNGGREIFGFGRLAEAIAAGPITSAGAMLDHLRQNLSAFVGPIEPHDDLTIVVIRV